MVNENLNSSKNNNLISSNTMNIIENDIKDKDKNKKSKKKTKYRIVNETLMDVVNIKKKQLNNNQKVGEFYIETLHAYKKKFNKEKLTIFMQVGSFFEIYGLLYPDGKREGNIWDISDQLGIRISEKHQKVYGSDEIKLVMSGVPDHQMNKFLQNAVDKYQWTIVIFEQFKIGNSNKYERKEVAVYSPGINIDADSYSNICMVIYMEQLRTLYSLEDIKRNNSKDDVLNIGIAYIDTLTGENNIMEIGSSKVEDTAIPFDELLKIITIKKPNELIIHLRTCQINDEDLINALHLFNTNYKIYRNELDPKYQNIQYQKEVLNSIYADTNGIMDILQQLDLDNIDVINARLALCILLDYIVLHDKSVISKLGKPDISQNTDKFLMLANNCLEQLDIIDNSKDIVFTDNKFGKKISLFAMLDKTKTTMGKKQFRKRLSMPVTDPQLLKKYYDEVNDFYKIEKCYIKSSTDTYGSPLSQIRNILFNIKNIDNYIRKLVTYKLHPSDIESIIMSLTYSIELIDKLNEFKSEYGNKYLRNICELIPTDDLIKNIKDLIEYMKNSIKLSECKSLWSEIENNIFYEKVFEDLDELQMDIKIDRNLVEQLVIKLSKLIEPSWTGKKEDKDIVCVSENSKLGLHIYTNNSRKEKLEIYFYKNNVLEIGKYKITKKDIKFLKLKENKWHLDISYLKINSGNLKHNIETLIKETKKKFKEWSDIIVNKYYNDLIALSKFISYIDVNQSIAFVSIKNGYVKPKIKLSDNSYIKAKQIRHPIIEYINQKTKYVPNDIELGTPDQNGILLFGINAVGKSSCMKSIGINIIMAQSGLFVPCESFIYHPYKYLFTRIRNNDNLYAGLSSFEVEMKEFKVILKYANKDSIILGDELCSGTETKDATALVASGIIQLSKRNSNFIFATHLHFLADMDYIKKIKNLKLYHLLVERDPKIRNKLIYTRKLQPGSGPKSYGILVCESMNLDNKFIELAKEIRNTLNIDKELPEVDVKNSKYNKNKIVTFCEVCKKNSAVDTHHINQQCNADNSGMIDNYHKNEKWNLVALCKKCHISVHNSPPNLIIQGYVQTNMGINLKYKWINKHSGNNSGDNNDSDDDHSDNDDKINSNNGYYNNTDTKYFNNTITNNTNNLNDNNLNDNNLNDNNLNDNDDNLDSSDSDSYSDEENLTIPEIIINLKKEGHSPKKIQNILKREQGLVISQNQIRGVN